MEMLNILFLDDTGYDNTYEDIALINNFYSAKSVRRQMDLKNGGLLRYKNKHGTT